MQVRRLRVQIETERLRIVGTLQLPIEGYRSRVTDYLNAHDTGFIALTEADIIPVVRGEPEHRDFVAVGCRHIAALAELEDLGVIDEELPRTAGLSSTSVPPPGE
jgi:hypothetical protein